MSLDVKELESKTLKLNFLHIAIQMYYRYVTIDVIFTFIHAQNMQVGHLTLFTLFYVCTLGDTGFFRLQGILKCTVSWVFENLKFKISDGSDQN